MGQVLGGGESRKEEHLGRSKLKCEITKGVSTVVQYIIYRQYATIYQYSDIKYALDYNVATCFDRKRSSSGQ